MVKVEKADWDISAFIIGGFAAMFGNLTLTIFCSAIIIVTGLAKGYDEE